MAKAILVLAFDPSAKADGKIWSIKTSDFSKKK